MKKCTHWLVLFLLVFAAGMVTSCASDSAEGDQFRNSLSLDVDIETGGHVFQLMATNAQGMIEQFFIPRNAGSWSNGGSISGLISQGCFR